MLVLLSVRARLLLSCRNPLLLEKISPEGRKTLHMHHTQTPYERSEDRPPRPLWRNRDFLLLWSGQTISVLGTNISTLALPLLVLVLTHSPALAGLLTAMRLLPYLLFSLPAGAFIDRWDRKAVMIRCDIVRWLALGSVPLAFASGYLTVAQLYIVAFIEGTAYVLFSLAQISALPRVVSPTHLPRAYALDTTTEYVGSLLGPGLGGLSSAWRALLHQEQCWHTWRTAFLTLPRSSRSCSSAYPSRPSAQ